MDHYKGRYPPHPQNNSFGRDEDTGQIGIHERESSGFNTKSLVKNVN